MNAIIDEYAKNYVEKYVNEKLFLFSLITTSKQF